MILGVPVFTVIFAFIKWLIDRRLMRKNLPSDTDDYGNVDHYDYDKGEFVFLPENYGEEKREARKEEKRKRRELRRNRHKKSKE